MAQLQDMELCSFSPISHVVGVCDFVLAIFCTVLSRQMLVVLLGNFRLLDSKKNENENESFSDKSSESCGKVIDDYTRLDHI